MADELPRYLAPFHPKEVPHFFTDILSFHRAYNSFNLSIGFGEISRLRLASYTVQAVMTLRYYANLVLADGTPYPLASEDYLVQFAFPAVYLVAGVILLVFGETIAAVFAREDRVIRCAPPENWERSWE